MTADLLGPTGVTVGSSSFDRRHSFAATYVILAGRLAAQTR